VVLANSGSTVSTETMGLASAIIVLLDLRDISTQALSQPPETVSTQGRVRPVAPFHSGKEPGMNSWARKTTDGPKAGHGGCPRGRPRLNGQKNRRLGGISVTVPYIIRLVGLSRPVARRLLGVGCLEEELMGRPVRTVGWWVKAVALAAALLLFALSGSFAFDRDYDGIDDGGLDFMVDASVEIPQFLFIGLILLELCGTRASVHYRFGGTPRSPPASR
jgi:hypothetical protein